MSDNRHNDENKFLTNCRLTVAFDEIFRWRRFPFFLAFTDDEGVPRNVCSQNWTLTTVPVLSLIKTVSSCVVQIVCVITNQGSSNPNCLKISCNAAHYHFDADLWMYGLNLSLSCDSFIGSTNLSRMKSTRTVTSYKEWAQQLQMRSVCCRDN